MGYGAVMACILLIVLCVIMAVVSYAAKRAQIHIGGEVE